MFVLYRISTEVSVGRTGMPRSKENLEVSFITKNYSPEFWPEGIGSCLFLEETSLMCRVWVLCPQFASLVRSVLLPAADEPMSHPPLSVFLFLLACQHPVLGKAWAELERGDHAQ